MASRSEGKDLRAEAAGLAGQGPKKALPPRPGTGSGPKGESSGIHEPRLKAKAEGQAQDRGASPKPAWVPSRGQSLSSGPGPRRGPSKAFRQPRKGAKAEGQGEQSQSQSQSQRKGGQARQGQGRAGEAS
jgi:hypothetical protein